MDTNLDADWTLVLQHLPDGWQAAARERGAFHAPRRGKVESEEEWLRVLLLYGGVGLSSQQTADAMALRGRRLSKVAVWKRAEGSEPFLQWLVGELLAQRVPPGLGWPSGYRFLAGDGSWLAGSQVELRLDWLVDLATLACVDVSLADRRVGESVTRWAVHPGDVAIVDGGFSRAGELAAWQAAGGEVIARWRRCSTRPREEDGSPVDVLAWLRSGPEGEVRERPVWLPTGDGGRLAGRLCAVKLSPEAAERARRKARRAAQKKGYRVEAATLEWAAWVVVFTTLPASRVTAGQVLELYRARWQVELVFKRLKSLLGADPPRAFRPEAARVRLLLKLVYALLLEACLAEAGAFSPSGGLRGGSGRRRGRGGRPGPAETRSEA